MSSMIGWRCKDCGEGESFYCGGGMMCFNEPEVVELSRRGKFGSAMKMLLGDGIPDGWTVYRENAFYLCPNCGAVIGGGTIRVDDEGEDWLVFHTKPGSCGSCGEELMFWDDKVPMSERELQARCEGVTDEGCMKCGSQNVELIVGNWD